MMTESEQRWWDFRGLLRKRRMTVTDFANLCERSSMQVRRVVAERQPSPHIEAKLAEVLGPDNPLAALATPGASGGTPPEPEPPEAA